MTAGDATWTIGVFTNDEVEAWDEDTYLSAEAYALGLRELSDDDLIESWRQPRPFEPRYNKARIDQAEAKRRGL